MPPPPAASALQKRLRQRKQQQVARKAVALSPEPEAADAQHASRGAADLAPPEDDTDGYMLHVRGVGGALEDEDRLKHVFSEFGGVMQATVRHRIADDGRNTSWALVTMTDKRAVEKALAAGARLHGQSGVTLSRFSKKQASESTGGMGQVRLESAAKMIQAKFRQKQAWEQAILKSMGIEVSTAVNTSILAKRWAKKSGLGAKLQRKKVARKAVALSPEPEAADAQHASRVLATVPKTGRLQAMKAERSRQRRRRALLKVRTMIWLSGAQGLRAAAQNGGVVPRSLDEVESTNVVHVRGVGGLYEDESSLVALFADVAPCLHALVRHRMDEGSGVNSSWALVTMESADAAQTILTKGVRRPDTGAALQLTPFDQKMAAVSKGGMQLLRKQLLERLAAKHGVPVLGATTVAAAAPPAQKGLTAPPGLGPKERIAWKRDRKINIRRAFAKLRVVFAIAGAKGFADRARSSQLGSTTPLGQLGTPPARAAWTPSRQPTRHFVVQSGGRSPVPDVVAADVEKIQWAKQRQTAGVPDNLSRALGFSATSAGTNRSVVREMRSRDVAQHTSKTDDSINMQMSPQQTLRHLSASGISPPPSPGLGLSPVDRNAMRSWADHAQARHGSLLTSVSVVSERYDRVPQFLHYPACVWKISKV
jgi:hypothetical protein